MAHDLADPMSIPLDILTASGEQRRGPPLRPLRLPTWRDGAAFFSRCLSGVSGGVGHLR
jgi:hypothetical protein